MPAPLPGVTTDEVDPAALRELRSLGRDRAERVGLHLASAVAALAEDDTDAAVDQVDAAVTLAPRLAVVRETAGLVRYRAGDFAHALRELRTARRMGSGTELVPVIVDCERAIGRPARALELAQEAKDLGLDRSTEIELAMVVAGTRRDLDDIPAALRALELPELRSAAPSSIRLRYAYAALLEAAGRTDEALSWFTRVAQVDADEETDAGERVLQLQGLSIESLEDEDQSEDDGDGSGEGAEADGDESGEGAEAESPSGESAPGPDALDGDALDRDALDRDALGGEPDAAGSDSPVDGDLADAPEEDSEPTDAADAPDDVPDSSPAAEDGDEAVAGPAGEPADEPSDEVVAQPAGEAGNADAGR